MSFRSILFGDSTCSHLKILRSQTEVTFKFKVKLDLKYNYSTFLGPRMQTYLMDKMLTNAFQRNLTRCGYVKKNP